MKMFASTATFLFIIFAVAKAESTNKVDPMECEKVTSRLTEATNVCGEIVSPTPAGLTDEEVYDYELSSRGTCILDNLKGAASFFDELVDDCTESTKGVIKAETIYCVDSAFMEACNVDSTNEDSDSE